MCKERKKERKTSKHVDGLKIRAEQHIGKSNGLSLKENLIDTKIEKLMTLEWDKKIF